MFNSQQLEFTLDETSDEPLNKTKSDTINSEDDDTCFDCAYYGLNKCYKFHTTTYRDSPACIHKCYY